MAIATITPSSEAVSLAEAKAQMRILHDDEDAEISRKVKAARQFVETFTGKTLLSTTLDVVLDNFPRGPVKLPRGPLQSVTGVFYIDPTSGLEVTLAADQYQVDAVSDPGWIAPVSCWPSTMATVNAVRIRFVAGYGSNPEDVPEPLREAILQIGAQYFENREAVFTDRATVLPMGVDAILNEYREWAFE